jgi:hypothetical protein
VLPKTYICICMCVYICMYIYIFCTYICIHVYINYRWNFMYYQTSSDLYWKILLEIMSIYITQMLYYTNFSCSLNSTRIVNHILDFKGIFKYYYLAYWWFLKNKKVFFLLVMYAIQLNISKRMNKGNFELSLCAKPPRYVLYTYWVTHRH